MRTSIRRAAPARHEPAAYVMPSGVGDLADALRTAYKQGDTLRVSGRAHSVASLAAAGYPEPDGLLVSTVRLQDLVDVDPEAGTVTAEAGMTLRTLNDRLGVRGLALDNPGDASGRTLGGALACGIYGAGGRFGSLASQVVALDLLCADGTPLHCSAEEEPEAFAAACVSLGALGVVTRVTMRTVTGFNVATHHTVESFESTLDSLEARIAASDYFECRWFPHTDQVALRRGERSSAPPGGRGNLAWLSDRALGRARISLGASRLGTRWPQLLSPQVRAPREAGRRDYCDRGYRVLGDSSEAAAVTADWALPRPMLSRALRELSAWQARQGSGDGHSEIAGPVRVQGGVADDAWMSGAYGRPSGFVAVPLASHSGQGAAAAIAGMMVALGGRPRWGSVHPLGAAELQPGIPRWEDWQAQRRRLDPRGRFATATLERLLGPVD